MYFQSNEVRLLFNVKNDDDGIEILNHRIAILNYINQDAMCYTTIIFGYDNVNMFSKKDITRNQ